MRELKFRYRYRQTCPDGLGSSQIITRTYTMDEVEEFAKPWPFLEDILSRDEYISLKDKNGVEIYEGDIVNIKGNPHEVYWDTTAYQFRLAAFGDRQFDKTKIPMFAKVSEVIGNIYENKELLGK